MPSFDSSSPDSCKILLVEDDPRLLEMLVEAFVGRFDANLTCVGCAEDALDAEIIEPHDIVVAEIDLPVMDGLTLTRHLKDLSDRPVILLAEEPGLSHAIEAMRLGACDMFCKPFAIAELLGSMNRALQNRRSARITQTRYHRMRHLVRHVIRERRDLNRRMELVCRDLVGAQRQLVHRVLAQDVPADWS